jgi:hypothetical protein
MSRVPAYCALAAAGLVLVASPAAPVAVGQTRFNDAGLPRLSGRVGQPFAVQSVVLIDADGNRQAVKAEPKTFALAGGGKRIDAAYSWGKVACAYSPSADGRRLDLRVTVTNTSDRTIQEVRVLAAKLRLGEGARGGGHHNIGAPTVIALRTADRSLAVCNPDVRKPLAVRVERPRDGIADVTIHAGGYAMPYDDLYLSRPIAPGQRDTYALSIRTAPAGTDPHDLGTDIYRKFAAAHPPALDWPDRRPINRLFFRGGAPKEQIIAYYRDPENNPPPKGGNEKFQKNVLNGIRRAVAAAKETGAQGLIIWNIEGGSFPHPTTYIGDPRVVKIFNPDFDAVADEAFRLITDAGLHAGVCIRPTQITYTSPTPTPSATPSPPCSRRGRRTPWSTSSARRSSTPASGGAVESSTWTPTSCGAPASRTANGRPA